MNVLLADDHGLMRDALRHYVVQLDAAASVHEAADLDGVRTWAAHQPQPDLILLDLQMPGMDGLESVAEVRGLCPNAAIVVVSAHDDRTVIVEAIRRGANGYVPKTMGGKSVLTALRLVLAGETYIPASVLGGSHTAPSSPVAPSPGNFPGSLGKLSAREADVLRELIGGRSNKEIARLLNVQETTVKVHLRNVYRKIKANNRVDAVRIVLSQGGLKNETVRT